MTNIEHEKLCKTLEDMFPYGKWSEERFGVVWKIFNRYVYYDVMRAFRTYSTENPDVLSPTKGTFSRVIEILTGIVGVQAEDGLTTKARAQRDRCITEARARGDHADALFWESATDDRLLDEYDRRVIALWASRGVTLGKRDSRLSRPWAEPMDDDELTATNKWAKEVRDGTAAGKIFETINPTDYGKPLTAQEADKLRDQLKLYRQAAAARIETAEQRIEREARKAGAEKASKKPVVVNGWTKKHDWAWTSEFGEVCIVATYDGAHWYGYPANPTTRLIPSIGPYSTVERAMAGTEMRCRELRAEAEK